MRQYIEIEGDDLVELPEDKPVKVYLSHSIADYGSEYIDWIVNDLYSIYGDDAIIIDPSEQQYQDRCVDEKRPGGYMMNMIEVFYPLIDECDVLVAIRKNDTIRYTPGVLDEIRYAERIGKEVFRY